MAKKTGNLEKDFDCIILHAIASRVVDEASTIIESETLFENRKKINKQLTDEANECYKVQCNAKSGNFFSIKDATKMRDTLTCFMRHWLSSIMNDQYPIEYIKLPQSFKNGEFR